MFIFDADTHLTLTETPHMSIEELISSMDQAGIEKSIIWPQPPYMRALDNDNKYVYESWKKHPNRLVHFGWIDPRQGIDAAEKMLSVCLDEYGMKGIKMNCGSSGIFADDSSLDSLYCKMEKENAVLAYHIGADFYTYAHPYYVGKVAEHHPNLRIICVHMGGAGKPDLVKECIDVARENRNIILVGSAVSYVKILNAIQQLGSERVCFGSDAPFAYQRVEVAAYKALMEGIIPQRDIENVMGLSIKKFLE